MAIPAELIIMATIYTYQEIKAAQQGGQLLTAEQELALAKRNLEKVQAINATIDREIAEG